MVGGVPDSNVKQIVRPSCSPAELEEELLSELSELEDSLLKEL